MDTSDRVEEDLPATQPVDDRILKNVIAYVEVRSTNDNRSKAICKELEQLGAIVVEKFTDIVTHVVFKEGSKRTKNKAKKMGVHLVSVLWVDSCKKNQEHVSERLFPANLPNEKATPTYFALKMKKAKSMQPRDFNEDVASSAERCTKRKNKRVELMDKLKSNDGTPINSPLMSKILVLETQPRSPIGDLSTPVRLTIPDTPASMKAKLKELQEAKLNGSALASASTTPVSCGLDDEPLQRNLFSQFIDGGSPSSQSLNNGYEDKEDPIPSPKPPRSVSLPDDVMLSAMKRAKSTANSRRKTIATVTTKSLLEENNKEMDHSESYSLTEKQSNKKASNRRKSITGTVTFAENVVEIQNKGRSNSRRKSVAATVTFAEDVDPVKSKARRNPRRKSVAAICQSDSYTELQIKGQDEPSDVNDTSLNPSDKTPVRTTFTGDELNKEDLQKDNDPSSADISKSKVRKPGRRSVGIPLQCDNFSMEDLQNDCSDLSSIGASKQKPRKPGRRSVGITLAHENFDIEDVHNKSSVSSLGINSSKTKTKPGRRSVGITLPCAEFDTPGDEFSAADFLSESLIDSLQNNGNSEEEFSSASTVKNRRKSSGLRPNSTSTSPHNPTKSNSASTSPSNPTKSNSTSPSPRNPTKRKLSETGVMESNSSKLRLQAGMCTDNKSVKRKGRKSVVSQNEDMNTNCVDLDSGKNSDNARIESDEHNGEETGEVKDAKEKSLNKGRRKSIIGRKTNAKSPLLSESSITVVSELNNVEQSLQGNKKKTKRKSMVPQTSKDDVSATFVNDSVKQNVKTNQKSNKSLDSEATCHTQSETSEANTQIESSAPNKKNIPKKKLLSMNELDPASFLIEPTVCSENVRPAIIEEQSGKKKSTNKSSGNDDQSGTKKTGKKRLNSKNSTSELKENITKKTKESKNSVSDLKENISDKVKGLDNALNDRKVNKNNVNCKNNSDEDKMDTSSVVTAESNSVLSDISMSTQSTCRDMSMSMAYGDNTLPSFCGRLPQRQSILDFNLKKFPSRVKGRKRLVQSDSSVLGKENSDSGIKSSDSTTSDSDSGPSLSRHFKKKTFGSQTINKRSPHRPALVMTSLHRCEQDVVISVLRKLGGFMLTDNVADTTSHLICGGPRRTLNVLQAMARGCWLVRKEWVLQSLEAGHWLPEEEYEAIDWFPAAKTAREEKEHSKNQKYKSELFSSTGSIFVCPKSLPPRNDLISLIKTCSGKVTNSLSKAEVFVGSDFYPDKTCVKPLWLLDCITQHELLPTSQYCVGQPKRESSPEF